MVLLITFFLIEKTVTTFAAFSDEADNSMKIFYKEEIPESSNTNSGYRRKEKTVSLKSANNLQLRDTRKRSVSARSDEHRKYFYFSLSLTFSA